MKFGHDVIGLGEHQGSTDELAQRRFFDTLLCIRLLSSQFSSQMSDGRRRHGTAPHRPGEAGQPHLTSHVVLLTTHTASQLHTLPDITDGRRPSPRLGLPPLSSVPP